MFSFSHTTYKKNEGLLCVKTKLLNGKIFINSSQFVTLINIFLDLSTFLEFNGKNFNLDSIYFSLVPTTYSKKDVLRKRIEALLTWTQIIIRKLLLKTSTINV